MQWLAKFIYFKLLGWRIVGNTNFPQSTLKKAVIIAVPHTSWHDFYIGVLLRAVLQIKTNFIAKKELFEKKEEFRLTLAPEGTRKKVEKWRTGFYYIAKAAIVPIIMFTLDFQNKQSKISEPFYPTDDMEADFKFMHQFYKGIVGKVKKYS